MLRTGTKGHSIYSALHPDALLCATWLLIEYG
jgi:hypothetical protein